MRDRGPLADADVEGDEGENRDRGVARQIVQMTQAARFAAEARELGVGVIEKIRHDHEQCRNVGPAVRSQQKRRGAEQPNRQTNGREMMLGAESVSGSVIGASRFCHQNRIGKTPGVTDTRCILVDRYKTSGVCAVRCTCAAGAPQNAENTLLFPLRPFLQAKR